ncbi:MAG TPA: glycosyltransferase family 39 protein [Nitrospinaceae bacterium]|nr:glycosyltransferase family 39 protein [Nitrospinaceae bacterium]
MQTKSLPDNLYNRGHLQLIVFTLLCFLAFTYNLSEVPPYHADENFYVTSTRNMIETNDYITPMYHDKKRFAKPILFYWLVATSYKTFGVNLFSARLVSSLFGAFCIPITYMIARRLFDHKTAIISALLLPGCYLHFQIARWAITDMSLNFFILSTFYFFIRGFQEESNKGISYFLMYICMGIGFMIKGPPAIIIPTLVIGCYILVSKNWEELPQLRLGYGIAIIAVIILPWLVTMLTIHGDEFKNHILGAELRDRIVHDTQFSLYYFGVIIRYYLPWSFFFIAALAKQFELTLISPPSIPLKENNFLSLSEKLKVWQSNITKTNNRAFLFCTLWILCPLLLFTLFRIEHSRYMLPVSAPIVIITAHFFSQLIDSSSGFQNKVFKIPFYLSLIFYLLIAMFTVMGIFFLHPHFSAPTGLIVLSVSSIFGSVLLFILYRSKKYFTSIIALSIIQIITLTSLSGNSLSFFNRYPMKKFANHILTSPQLAKRIGLYRLGNHRARMGVMTGLPSIYLNNPEELKLFIEAKSNVYVVMRRFDLESDFYNLPMDIIATDTGWKKLRIGKAEIELLLKNGLNDHLQKYSERYVLLKTQNE